MSLYNPRFFGKIEDGSLASAHEVLKIVEQALHPGSVVDVGCGTGSWLKVWSELGVVDLLGIDGDYVPREALLIPFDRFMAMDLCEPTGLSRRFDLVESLEVAEHLPESAADKFVSFLCSLGPVVLFSAAIPGQGGTHHVNEQWPEYWAELFLKQGYIVIDTLRDCLWDSQVVERWYRQNALFFVEGSDSEAIARLRSIPASCQQRPLSRVHPESWLLKTQKPRWPASPFRLLKR